MLKDNYNSLIVHPDFNKVLKDIGEISKGLPEPTYKNYEWGNLNNSSGNKKLKIIGSKETTKHKLNALTGKEYFDKNNIYAYDESYVQHITNEGMALLTCHSLVHVGDEYAPRNEITLNFYTGAENLAKKHNGIKFSKNPELDSKKDYYKERIELLKNVPSGSLLLIDGPLIAGDAYVVFIKSMESLLNKKILTAFFVKNSGGKVVIENIKGLKKDYNSDMHWATKFLKEGECTNFFQYIDPHNDRNARAFCFIKAYKNRSPQRVEFHLDTFKAFKNTIPGVMDMVYYLLLAQGDPDNPQVRPIAIAEKYARESLKLFNLNKMIKKSGLTDTMNQARGFTF